MRRLLHSKGLHAFPDGVEHGEGLFDGLAGLVREPLPHRSFLIVVASRREDRIHPISLERAATLLIEVVSGTGRDAIITAEKPHAMDPW